MKDKSSKNNFATGHLNYIKMPIKKKAQILYNNFFFACNHQLTYIAYHNYLFITIKYGASSFDVFL